MGFRDRIAELARGEPASETKNEPEPDDAGYFSAVDSDEIDRRTPESDDLENYWRVYETMPIVRKPIRRYADEIVEPGWHIDSDNEQLAADMESALEDAAIIAGEPGHDFEHILHNAIVQREVRGTAMVELVPRKGEQSDPDSMWGFRTINPATVAVNTYENQAVLVSPNDDPSMWGVPETPRGEAAAYVQFAEEALLGPFDEPDAVPLSQNDVVKLTLDPDADDIFGTSRIESIYPEVKGYRQILRDNEQAIEAKAYPHWIFKAGEPSGDANDPRRGVWPMEKLQKLKEQHSRSNFSAGQKDFLPGDVDVQKISGETADIDGIIDHYIEIILAAMPNPKFVTGFADDINRDITGEQQADYHSLIKQSRRELETKFRPALERKARDLGYSEDEWEELSLKIEQDSDVSPLKDADFSAEEFGTLMNGLAAASAQNNASDVMPIPEIRQRVLGLEPKDELPDELRSTVEDPDEEEATEQAANFGLEDTRDADDAESDVETDIEDVAPARADD